jgi:pimeloyl-ACP methyl ester carboxylesterase
MIETGLHLIPTAPRPELETAGPFGSLYQRIQVSLNVKAGVRPRTAIIAIHPAGNYLMHYTMAPFAEAGFASIGIASRFAGNDSMLFMEQVMLDLGGAVRFARQQGFEQVVLFGNSGGGSVVATYQSQAERPTITCTPAGDPPDLTQAELIPADGVVFFAAHPGRAQVFTEGLDPSVVDERDPYATDASLDMYDSRNGPPYSPEFLERYRAAQVERNHRITRWAWAKLAELAARNDGARDIQFPLYRTGADPRFLDTSIDPSDRRPGTFRGDPRLVNINTTPGGLARCSTLRSWLSQWSLSATHADGHSQARNISKPVLCVTLGGDQGVFPPHLQGYYDAIPHENKELAWVPHAIHFLGEQPDKRDEALGIVIDWLRRKGF